MTKYKFKKDDLILLYRNYNIKNISKEINNITKKISNTFFENMKSLLFQKI